MRSVTLTIHGQPPRKSNSRRIVRNRSTGSPMSIKSKDALSYLESLAWQVRADQRLALGDKTHPLVVEGDIFYRTRFRADLSIELILDALQKARVISDDRYVVAHAVTKRWDHENPRAVIRIEELDEWDWKGDFHAPLQ